MNPLPSASAPPSLGDKRAAINRQNAARSTGPVTPEGMRRASLNALRHGLTGQTVVLPEDDLAAYRSSCAQFHTELKPQGLLETEAVQTIADTYWRLDRIRAMENNLFALGVHEHTGDLGPDPAIHCALAQAKSLEERGDLFVRLSLRAHSARRLAGLRCARSNNEQRLTRTLTLAKAELKQLQQDRANAREHALEAAAQIRNLKEALTQPWQPGEHGFEFSDAELTLWMNRRQLTDQAHDFEYHGRLPLPEAETPEAETNDEACPLTH